MWDHWQTYLLGSLVASMGGAWYYFDTHTRSKRRIGDVLISMLGSGLLGMVVAIVSCYYLCEREQALPLVVAISAMSGLLGWTPQYAISLFRRLREQPHEPPAHGLRPSPEPDSDNKSPFD